MAACCCGDEGKSAKGYVMTILKHQHLTTLTLDVDFPATAGIGATPAGIRRIAPVTGGTFVGDRLSGTARAGADWAVIRPDGALNIDVRLTLETHDHALIYLQYAGRFVATPDGMARFSKGVLLDPADYSLVITAKFESGDERYVWLNNVIAVGTGEQTPNGPIYSLFEVG